MPNYNLNDAIRNAHAALDEVARAAGGSTSSGSCCGSSQSAPSGSVQHFSVNVYDSSQQAFALGSKLHAGNNAERHASCNAIGVLHITLVNGEVQRTGSGDGDRRFWALLRDGGSYKLGKNSYAELSKLEDAYPNASAYLQVSRDSNDQMSVAAAE